MNINKCQRRHITLLNERAGGKSQALIGCEGGGQGWSPLKSLYVHPKITRKVCF